MISISTSTTPPDTPTIIGRLDCVTAVESVGDEWKELMVVVKTA